MGILKLFAGCFCGHELRRSEAQGPGAVSAITAEDWRSVPDDVFQLVLPLLAPGDVGAARLACAAWRLLLSAQVSQLVVPLSFLEAKGARGALRRTAQVFPCLSRVTLVRSLGWCDPVQARMDLEPLVCLVSRPAPLEPLTVLQPGLTELTLVDAAYTRHPMSLAELVTLAPGGLRRLGVWWDTALWAPGQALQEAEGLAPLFTLTGLVSLTLHKSAALYLGEAGLGEGPLGALTALTRLVNLELGAVKTGEEGLGALAALTGLTRLVLRGQVTSSLATLHATLASLSCLEELDLQQLAPTNHDLAVLVAAQAELTQQQAAAAAAVAAAAAAPNAWAGGGSSSGGWGAATHGSSSQGTQQYGQSRGQTQAGGTGAHSSSATAEGGTGAVAGGTWDGRAAGGAGGSTAGGTGGGTAGGTAGGTPFTSWASASSGGWLSVADAAAAAAAAAAGGGGGAASSSTGGVAPNPPGPTSVNTSHGQTLAHMVNATADWSVALSPLRRLKRLTLASDLTLLGSCAALRALPQLSSVSLKGNATYLGHTGGEDSSSSGGGAPATTSSSSLPPSWLLQPGVSWAALQRLSVHKLHVADALLGAVTRLTGLQQLVLSGSCMLTSQTQPPPRAASSGELQEAAAAGQASSSSGRGREVPGGDSHGTARLSESGAWLHSSDSPLLQGLTALTRLTKFELHTPPYTPSSASVSNHVLGLLLQHWTGLKSLALCLREEPEGSPGQSQGVDLVTDPITALSCCSSLEDLSISVAGFDRETSDPRPSSPSNTAAAAAAAGGVVAWRSVAGAGHAAMATTAAAGPTTATGSSSSSRGGSAQQGSLHTSATAATAGGGGGGGGRGGGDGGGGTSSSSSPVSSRGRTLLKAAAAPPAAAAGGAGGAAAVNAAGVAMGWGPGLSSSSRAPGSPPAAAGAAALHSGGTSSSRRGSLEGGGSCWGHSLVSWGFLPQGLLSLSLSGVLMEEEHVEELAGACRHLRHMRLLHCQVGHAHLWRIAQGWPHLASLVVKESPLDGLSANGLCAVASLTELTALGVTVAGGVDVRPLVALTGLRYLLLDARSNAALGGVKALKALTGLRCLVLPLLALHAEGRGQLLASLVASLPRCVISNVSSNLGVQHGCQWFSHLSDEARVWWQAPPVPWEWHPTFAIVP